MGTVGSWLPWARTREGHASRTVARASFLNGGIARARPTSRLPGRILLARGLGAVEAQLFADLAVHLFGAARAVHGHDQLLAPEEAQDGLRLPMVRVETGPDRVGGVVGTRLERSAADVADGSVRGAVVNQVVVEAAARAEPSAQHALDGRLGRQPDLDHGVDVERLEEEERLLLAAREAVQDEAVVPVVLREPVLHDLA